ncbi:hypothetical protein L21SP5_01014 [Salinivirga cyanobacteriivorans]|uniref:Putative auto-transporter adhesin head GIN domain-containing protein n=1 Tax=Salinivirga cyanobacteriivorans TaxID=1307839 RepID=A0A0S2HX66_9BACT|nr:DUF2807 domain-containing protein [Salinivirga cyanobacteriivorans]ALO14681.1 hypothetical protein L21SP5_01014 [Salinivirga cyanobacteriivorans]
MSIKVSIFTKFSRVSALLLVFWALLSCDLIYDEGDWTGEQRNFGDYQEVVLNGIANVYYHYSDTPLIKVYYYAKHLSNITTNIENQRITIDNEFGGQWYTDLRLPEIHLYNNAVNYVDIKEAGAFFCIDTIQSNHFNFYMHGDVFEAKLLLNVNKAKIDVYNSTGLMEVTGICNELEIYNKGETQIEAINFQARNAHIIQQSVMDVSSCVSDSLYYRIIRNGNITVKGNPVHEGEILGNGELILVEDE